MAFTDQAPPPPSSSDQSMEAGLEFDFNRLAANVLLTVQALQALHAAFDQRFTR